jgi:hypothetical protein
MFLGGKKIISLVVVTFAVTSFAIVGSINPDTVFFAASMPELASGKTFQYTIHNTNVLTPPEENGTLKEFNGPTWNLTILSIQGENIEVASTRNEFENNSSTATLTISQQVIKAINFTHSYQLDVNGQGHLTDVGVELTHPYFLPSTWHGSSHNAEFMRTVNESFQPEMIPLEWRDACRNLTARGELTIYPGDGIWIRNIILEEPVEMDNRIVWQQKIRNITISLLYLRAKTEDINSSLVMLDCYYLGVYDLYANGTRTKYTKQIVLHGWNPLQPASSLHETTSDSLAGWHFLIVVLALPFLRIIASLRKRRNTRIT